MIEGLDLKSRLSSQIWSARNEALAEISPMIQQIEERVERQTLRMLDSFHQAGIADCHLQGSTGYGYGDTGRELLDQLFSAVFGGETALVRSQIVSGTHAIALALFGCLRSGGELLSVTGNPYDSLATTIGLRTNKRGSLSEMGVRYRQIELLPSGEIDLPTIRESVNQSTQMILLQRSRGYAWRPAISNDEIARVADAIHQNNPCCIVFVDNCYGEFVEDQEPIAVGADLMAGSLIKNPGGGIAPTGGYVVGRKDLVEAAAYRLTAPGIGGEVGATMNIRRLLYQGFFSAPKVVGEALKGAVFAANFFARLGFETSPRWDAPRGDIIQAIRFGSRERLLRFCEGIQRHSPVDSLAVPEANQMPGYADPVVMAAGTFIQGSTAELSADAPLREPYIAYLQGGLSAEHVRIACVLSAQELLMG